MRIALIGCGKQAIKHLRGLRKCPGVEVIVADKEVERARALAEAEGLAWVEHADQLFADPNVAAVVLCVPVGSHATLIRQCVAAGKHFFCEKPSCETAAQARELNDLTQRSQRIGMIGYVYRFAPVFQKAHAVLASARDTGTSPVIGKLSVAIIRIGGRGSAALWKHRRAEGGGALNEMLVHMIDLAVWCLGPIERAELMMNELLRPQRMIAGRIETVDAEDFVLARFWTRSGVPVIIQADLVTPAFTQLFEVHGDNGTLMASIQPEMPQFVFTLEPAGGYAAGRTELDRGKFSMFEAQMEAFVAAVRDGTEHLGGTPADSVRVMEAIDALRDQDSDPLRRWA
ncbi:MAG: Gfo/Idh/MocA family oxidoreductase [Stellaceae bacterium]